VGAKNSIVSSYNAFRTKTAERYEDISSEVTQIVKNVNIKDIAQIGVCGLIPPVIIFRRYGRFIKTVTGLAGLSIGSIITYPQGSARFAKDFVQSYEQGTLQQQTDKYLQKLKQLITPTPKPIETKRVEKVAEKHEDHNKHDSPKAVSSEIKPKQAEKHEDHNKHDSPKAAPSEIKPKQAEKHEEKLKAADKHDDHSKHEEKSKANEMHVDKHDSHDKHQEKSKVEEKHDEHHTKTNITHHVETKSADEHKEKTKSFRKA